MFTLILDAVVFVHFGPVVRVLSRFISIDFETSHLLERDLGGVLNKERVGAGSADQTGNVAGEGGGGGGGNTC